MLWSLQAPLNVAVGGESLEIGRNCRAGICNMGCRHSVSCPLPYERALRTVLIDMLHLNELKWHWPVVLRRRRFYLLSTEVRVHAGWNHRQAYHPEASARKYWQGVAPY